MEYIENVALIEEEYVKPRIEIIDIESEGILAASSDAGGFGHGDGYGEW
jgi:hypothetical protein